jgi:hypothetical protein
MKSICLVIVSAVLLATGCAAIQERKNNDRTRDCMALCTAIEAAQCWDNPTLMDGLHSAANLSSCLNACNDNYNLIAAIDFSCLSAAKGCDLIDKCVDFEVGK